MKRSSQYKFALIVPIIALIVIAIQVYIVKTQHVSKWKGGGFGMYTETHFVFYEVWINNKNIETDTLYENKTLRRAIKELKLTPNTKNLNKVANLFYEKSKKDTIKIEVWKPKTTIENSKYTRVLINKIYRIN